MSEKLYFKHGPMGSMKTTDLLVVATNYRDGGHNVLVAKPAVDTKGDNRLVSRINGVSCVADFLVTPDMKVRDEVLRQRQKMGGASITALLIDEAQFLSPEQVDELMALTLDGMTVMTWGLRTDFQTHFFPGSLRLMEIAHITREAVTMCGNGDGCTSKAMFNARKINDIYVAEGGQVAIDGEGDVTYTSLCAVHYTRNVGQIAAAAALPAA